MQSPVSGTECHEVVQDGDRLTRKQLCGRQTGAQEIEGESAMRSCSNVSSLHITKY